MLKRMPLLIVLALIISFMAWLKFGADFGVVKTSEVSKGFDRFVSLNTADEYVLAQLSSNEEFNLEKYTHLLGYTIGDTKAQLSLVANYKYYVKLAELKHSLQNEVFTIEAPALYLAKPVAFEFSSVRESSHRFLFGPSGKELLKQLKAEVDGKLITKGQAQMSAVYDKAAKALAENFNKYFAANGYDGYYKTIVVKFTPESGESRRQFSFER